MLSLVKKLEDGYKGRRIIVERHVVKNDSGKEFTFEIAKVQDAVAVLGETDDGKLILLKNFRYPVGEELYEVPAGLIDKDEKPEDAARRELEEETGYKADRVNVVGEFYTSPGFITEKLYLFVAHGLKKGEQKLEPAEEGLVVIELHKDEGAALLLNNNVRDIKTALLLTIFLM
jgi:ADP-ribose pyrophosphatase